MNPIIAISTPVGKGAIGIIRISFGNLKRFEVENIFLILFKKILIPNYLTSVILRNNKKIFDKGLAVFFKKPRSYTGEDILEYHGHGNFLNLKLILNFLLKKFNFYNFKLAKPGEFTKRAFINNKLNLFELENIFNIINSNNKYFLNLIHKNYSFNFNKKIKFLVNSIKNLIFFLEKKIILIKNNISLKINYKLNYILKKILKIIKNINFIKINELNVTLWGFVNVGKSSIINKIIRKNYSIISSIPGTTRDSLKKYVYVNNFLICFIDTAGVNYINNKIDNLSIKLSIKSKKKSKILIFIFDNFLDFLNSKKKFNKNQYLILILNKIDLLKKKSNLEINFLKKKHTFINLSNKFNIGFVFFFNELIRLFFNINKIFNSLNINTFFIKSINIFYKNILKSIIYNKKKLFFLLLNELKKSFYNINSLINNKISLKKINIIFNNLCIGK